METKSVKENVADAAKILKSISNERRLEIVCALHEGEKSVGTLEQIVGLSQSALSQHLARLRRDNIVSTRREAQTIYYALSSEKIYSILHCLYSIYCTDCKS